MTSSKQAATKRSRTPAERKSMAELAERLLPRASEFETARTTANEAIEHVMIALPAEYRWMAGERAHAIRAAAWLEGFEAGIRALAFEVGHK